MKQEDLTTLKDVATPDNKLKEYIINYTGEKLNPEDGNVTLEMIIDIIAKDFPELILCVSEENWIRGYQQALTDVEEGERLMRDSSAELHKE